MKASLQQLDTHTYALRLHREDAKPVDWPGDTIPGTNEWIDPSPDWRFQSVASGTVTIRDSVATIWAYTDPNYTREARDAIHAVLSARGATVRCNVRIREDGPRLETKPIERGMVPRGTGD
jgi:hypothetical protein